ncbi:polysaccharide pyruvyl transferase family protein [Shewanella benthica]
MGNICLLRQTFGDDIDIWALSEYPERDAQWYGIHFIPISVQSLSPFDMLTLLKKAKEFDIIFWGGGELLKDYTNKLSLIYWVIKIYLVSLVNPNVYGMFQGIGPTHSKFGKNLIRFIVGRCKVFFTRDDESKQKLLNWGVKTKIISSFDPAILQTASQLTDETVKMLKTFYDIDETLLNNFIGVGPRNWFHYNKSSWLPYKYRQLLPFQKKAAMGDNSMIMKMHIASLLDDVVQELDTNIIFFPMHMSETENDVEVSRTIISYMRNGERTRVLDKDNISPQHYLNIVSHSKLFIGVRLHSTILATVAKIPSFVFYYVDKGRLYFEQIGLKTYSAPIESILNKEMLSEFKDKIIVLKENETNVKTIIDDNLLKMRTQISDVFKREVFRR